MEEFERSSIVETTLTLVVGGERPSYIWTLSPLQPQPAQIFQHRRDEIHSVTRGIEIFITQNKDATCGSRALLRDPEGAGVTKMQMTGRGGRESPAISGMCGHG